MFVVTSPQVGQLVQASTFYIVRRRPKQGSLSLSPERLQTILRDEAKCDKVYVWIVPCTILLAKKLFSWRTNALEKVVTSRSQAPYHWANRSRGTGLKPARDSNPESPDELPQLGIVTYF